MDRVIRSEKYLNTIRLRANPDEQFTSLHIISYCFYVTSYHLISRYTLGRFVSLPRHFASLARQFISLLCHFLSFSRHFVSIVILRDTYGADERQRQRESMNDSEIARAKEIFYPIFNFNENASLYKYPIRKKRHMNFNS